MGWIVAKSLISSIIWISRTFWQINKRQKSAGNSIYWNYFNFVSYIFCALVLLEWTLKEKRKKYGTWSSKKYEKCWEEEVESCMSFYLFPTIFCGTCERNCRMSYHVHVENGPKALKSKSLTSKFWRENCYSLNIYQDFWVIINIFKQHNVKNCNFLRFVFSNCWARVIRKYFNWLFRYFNLI